MSDTLQYTSAALSFGAIAGVLWVATQVIRLVREIAGKPDPKDLDDRLSQVEETLPTLAKSRRKRSTILPPPPEDSNEP